VIATVLHSVYFVPVDTTLAEGVHPGLDSAIKIRLWGCHGCGAIKDFSKNPRPFADVAFEAHGHDSGVVSGFNILHAMPEVAKTQREIRDADLGRRVSLEDFRRAHRGDGCDCRGSCEEHVYEVRKPTQARPPGRNEKCPCGSGVKAKKCHCGRSVFSGTKAPVLRLCPRAIKEFGRRHGANVVEIADALHWKLGHEPAADHAPAMDTFVAEIPQTPPAPPAV
jgi:hypothetical protein